MDRDREARLGRGGIRAVPRVALDAAEAEANIYICRAFWSARVRLPTACTFCGHLTRNRRFLPDRRSRNVARHRSCSVESTPFAALPAPRALAAPTFFARA